MARWKSVRNMRIKAVRLGPIGFVRAHPSPVFVSGAIQKGVLRHKITGRDSGSLSGATMHHLDLDAILEGESPDAAMEGHKMGAGRFIEIEPDALNKGEWIQIGRTALSDVVINDYTVSKHHARIARRPELGFWILEELGSTNGTRFDEVQVSSGAEHRLISGTCVAFGRVEVTSLDAKGFFEFLRN